MTNCTLYDNHGYRRIDWMDHVFGECVHSPMEQASFWIGISSIVFWLFANFPQIYANFRQGSAKSLHLAFLVQWVLGDSFNLVGAVLTGQLTTQIVTAVYYICMDTILVTQWIFYTTRDRMRARKQQEVQEQQEDHEGKSLLRSALWTVVILIMFALVCSSYASSSTSVSSSPVLHRSIGTGRKLLSTTADSQFDILSSEDDHHIIFRGDDNDPGYDDGWPLKGPMDKIGYTIGCFSTTMYLGSRVPQIIKNFQRRSTEGLSLMLFLCAFLGNLTYSLSIFLFSTRKNFILGKLPWIIGSAGVLVMDFSILMQFLFFKLILKTEGKTEDHQNDELYIEHDEHDQTKNLYVGRSSWNSINE